MLGSRPWIWTTLLLSTVELKHSWGLCAYVIVHTILPPSPVILWIELGGKPKWLRKLHTMAYAHGPHCVDWSSNHPVIQISWVAICKFVHGERPTVSIVWHFPSWEKNGGGGGGSIATNLVVDVWAYKLDSRSEWSRLVRQWPVMLTDILDVLSCDMPERSLPVINTLWPAQTPNTGWNLHK